MSTRPCQANNPETCRYHGTLENHLQAYNDLNDQYMGLLRQALASGTHKLSLDNKIVKIREQIELAEASVDSHDANFLELLKERDLLRRKRFDNYLYIDTDYDYALEDLNKRIFNAETIRFKRDVSEKDHLDDGRVRASSAVRDLPVGVTVATGEKVVAVRRAYGRAVKGKMEVVLERSDGTRKTAYWNASTIIGYIQSPPQRPVDEISDPWAPVD